MCTISIRFVYLFRFFYTCRGWVNSKRRAKVLVKVNEFAKERNWIILPSRSLIAIHIRVPQTSFWLCGSSSLYSFEIIFCLGTHVYAYNGKFYCIYIPSLTYLHTGKRIGNAYIWPVERKSIRKMLMFRIHKGIVLLHIWTFLVVNFLCNYLL